jgi:hypothetical protein
MKWSISGSSLILGSSLLLLALSSPAMADCAQDISQLENQFKNAEGQAPVTEHQAQTMQMAPTDGATTMPSQGSGPDAASSEHQRQVLGGAGQESDQEKFVENLRQAKAAAQAGDEAACLNHARQAKTLLGKR